MKKIAIFASGAGTNSENITKYFEDGTHFAIVAIIISDNPTSPAIKKAHAHGIKSLSFSKEEFRNNQDKIINALLSNKIDFIVLAGFLSFIPKAIIDLYVGRIVNIHPSLLPKYGGKGMYGDNVHKAVIENKEKNSGITIHHVDYAYDNGNIIFQKAIEIEDNETAESLALKIHELEYKYYPIIIENEISKL